MANETKTENKSLSELLYEDIKKISGENSQENLFDDGNKNEVLQNDNKGGNDNSTQSGRNEEVQTDTTQNENAATTEGEENEGTQKVKGKRGRHVLNCDCEKCKAKRADGGSGSQAAGNGKKTKDASSNLVNELSKYRKVEASQVEIKNGVTTQQPDPNAGKIDLSKYISGALLLICMDAIFPTLIIKIAGYIDKKYARIKSTSKKKLKLTNEEKEELEPLADEIIKILFGMVHPAVAFIVATGIIYMGKVFALDDEDFREAPFKNLKTETTKKKR